MLDLKMLENVKYVIDSQGKKAAVQVDIQIWDAILGYLEDLEDHEVVKEKLDHLRKGPEKSGALPWQKTKTEW